MTEVRTYGPMMLQIHDSTESLGESAAALVRDAIVAAVAEHGDARVILATGNSQYPLMDALDGVNIPWSKVTAFHMDEYVGIDADHPASFRRWMRERVEERFQPAAMHYIDGNNDVEAEIARYTALLTEDRIDLVCMGIGENGHLAFNEPYAADFDTTDWVTEITLTPESRRQQVGEGHFASYEDVPATALSLTIPALLSSPIQVASVPEERKAEAVFRTVTEPVGNQCPATILRERGNAIVLVDPGSASRLPLA